MTSIEEPTASIPLDDARYFSRNIPGTEAEESPRSLSSRLAVIIRSKRVIEVLKPSAGTFIRDYSENNNSGCEKWPDLGALHGEQTADSTVVGLAGWLLLAGQ